MPKNLRATLLVALKSLLRPAVTFAVRRSFRIQDLIEAMKEVFLEVAEEELTRAKVAVNVSKLSAATGLHRRDVMRLWRDEEAPKRGADLVTRIIGQWQADERFMSGNGRPRTLELEGRKGSFAELVGSVSSDLNPYTVLFELERAGAVEKTERGIRLLRTAYQPREDIAEGLELLGEDSLVLMSAVSENVLDQPRMENLHIKTSYDNIPPSNEGAIREWFLQNGNELHKRARVHLSALDRDINPNAPGANIKSGPKAGRLRATVVTFSFTERVPEEAVSEGRSEEGSLGRTPPAELREKMREVRRSNG